MSVEAPALPPKAAPLILMTEPEAKLHRTGVNYVGDAGCIKGEVDTAEVVHRQAAAGDIRVAAVYIYDARRGIGNGAKLEKWPVR